MAIPAACGGDEVAVRPMLDAIEEVATHDGSTGWCVAIAATSGLVAAYLEPDAAGEIFDASTIAGGAFAPKGSAQPSDGGWRVTGRWPFASGCEHSTG